MYQSLDPTVPVILHTVHSLISVLCTLGFLEDFFGGPFWVRSRQRSAGFETMGAVMGGIAVELVDLMVVEVVEELDEKS